MYSKQVMDHFTNPRNVGEIENPSGIGEVGNPKCGDIMKMSMRIEDDIIKDIKFKTFGCGAAIATSSMATELVKGKTVEEALRLTNSAVVEALGQHAGACIDQRRIDEPSCQPMQGDPDDGLIDRRHA